jgi:hypothetical protein
MMKKPIFYGILVLFGSFLLFGCPLAPKSSNAYLSDLRIEGATLDETFSRGKTDYTAFLSSSLSSAKIVAVAEDSKATISYNANPLTLLTGENTARITVKAEDGTEKTYTITIWRGNTSINTLDSVAGSYLTQTIKYNVYKNGNLQYIIKKGLAENQPLYLDPSATYKLIASAEKRASSSIENYHYSATSDPIYLVCQKLEMSTYPAEAPSITSLAWTSDESADINDLDSLKESNWHEFSDGDEINISSLNIVRVIAKAKSEMDATSWAGQGIMLGVDEVPSYFAGLYPNNADSSYDNTTGYFTGEAYFGPLAGLQIADGEHQICAVVYDRSSNRVERSVSVTSISGPSSGVNLKSNYNIYDLYVEARTYGVSRQYYGARKSPEAMQALDSGPASYRIWLSFYVQKNSNNLDQPILGFRVYRSENGGSSYKYLATVNYGYPVSGQHTYYDWDGALRPEKSYKYKITAFTDSNNNHDLSESSAPIQLLAPYTISLTSPADGAKLSSGTIPTLKFRLSETSLWSSDKSDGFAFMPAIRKKTGETIFCGMYMYDMESDMLSYWDMPDWNWKEIVKTDSETLSDYFTFNKGTGEITLKQAALIADANLYSAGAPVLSAGVTYEWDIFGWWSDGNDPGNSENVDPPCFFKEETAHDSRYRSIYSESYSFSDSYEDGMDALNGWFELIAE